ncbi:TPA: hypothetical protein OWM05_001155 [Staphylococcus aureus]|nr:hypothetical protein [Staphylococcus aureus]
MRFYFTNLIKRKHQAEDRLKILIKQKHQTKVR